MNPLIITQGDPAGIGPELCLKAVAHAEVLRTCRPVIVGDLQVLGRVADRLGLPLPERVLTPEQGNDPVTLEALEGAAIIDMNLTGSHIEPGRPTKLAGEASYRYITYAIDGALAGRWRGLVTAPITKTTLQMAGVPEPGHTEILARRTGVSRYAMMLYSPRIAVVLVTIHQSLRSVPVDLTSERIRQVAGLMGAALRRIRGREPRLAVCGLNPHAGEGGMFGHEEIDIIAPAVEAIRSDGWQAEGPLPPDAAFMPHALQRYDGHVVMYHDQGLIPFKMISMEDGVNVTLGLPIVRTSVDHGTAYDIAWQGRASHSSMIAAIGLAAQLTTSTG